MPERATEHIDFSKSDQMKASIRLSADGFSFALYRPEQKQPLFFTRLEAGKTTSQIASVRQLFTDEEILNQDYRHVHIIVDSPRYTTLPAIYFKEEEKASVLHYNLPSKENEQVLSTLLPANDMVVIYGLNKYIYRLLTDKYKEVTFHSHAGILIDHLTSLGVNDAEKRMFANVHATRIDFYCFESQKLILVNSIDCRENTDRLYYLLNIWKQLDFDQRESKLYLIGESSQHDELITELKRFIIHISLLSTKQPDHIEATIPFDMQILPLGTF